MIFSGLTWTSHVQDHAINTVLRRVKMQEQKKTPSDARSYLVPAIRILAQTKTSEGLLCGGRQNQSSFTLGRDVIFLKRCYILDVTGFARINLVSHSEEMLYSLLYDWNRMQHVRHTALDSH